MHTHTDFYLPDVIPIELTRNYRSNDTNSYAFGIGTKFDQFGMYLWSAAQFQEVDLVLPDGAKIHYIRTSPGTGFSDAIFEHKVTSTSSVTPTIYNGSKITWLSPGWVLKLRDGTTYRFGENAPLQWIEDRYGNRLTIQRAVTNSYGNGVGNITGVTSPNGRSINFTYDASNRVISAQDNLGRTVTYAYTAGRLSQVTNPEGGISSYAYDSAGRMTSYASPRSIVEFVNVYDINNRVSRQTLPDGGVFTFNYTLDINGKITRTEVTDPRGFVRRIDFNTSGYIVSNTFALGRSEQQITTFVRDAGTNDILSATDPLGRTTTYAYDAVGNLLSTTRLAGTANAVTTRYTYEPTYSQITSITDPLNHTTTLGYD
ncbi:MAG: Teneurin-3, partial [Halothiobacillaceae bacterium]